MKALNPIAATAAVLFTAISLFAVNSNTSSTPVTEINGVKVIQLAPVNVRPDADERRAAALLTTAAVIATDASITRPAESAAGLLGAQLAMPYYSFGNKFARISKE